MNWAIVIFVVCSCVLSVPSTAADFEEKSAVELLSRNNATATKSPLNQTNYYGNSAENTDSTPDSTTEEDITSETSTSEPLSSSSSFTLITFPPGPTVPPSPSTTMHGPLVIEAANPPGWAIALISLMVVVSLILTGVIFVRRYCARKRKEERRYLLARSQESFFIGEQNNGFNEGL